MNIKVIAGFLILFFAGKIVFAQNLTYVRLESFAEKVYLHIDSVNYTSGNDIWFKAYVIDPATNKLSDNILLITCQ
jgi:hypothetical protein